MLRGRVLRGFSVMLRHPTASVRNESKSSVGGAVQTPFSRIKLAFFFFLLLFQAALHLLGRQPEASTGRSFLRHRSAGTRALTDWTLVHAAR